MDKEKMKRREFVKLSAGLAAIAAVGSSSLLVKCNKSDTDKIKGNNSKSQDDTKKIFAEKNSCAASFCFILNRECGNQDTLAENASMLLAPGLIFTGHQCGMLWGASLAAGTQSFRLYNDHGIAIGQAISISQRLVKSLSETANSINCRDITGCDLSKTLDLVKFTLKGIVDGPEKNLCATLAGKWAPLMIKTSKEGFLQKSPEMSQFSISCASEVAKKMGASDEEMVRVAGLAGGIGLSGNGCGALGAALYMKTLDWCRKNPKKTPFAINNSISKNLLKKFYNSTGSEILCSKICGKTFTTIGEHTEFIKNGGCNKLIDMLAHV